MKMKSPQKPRMKLRFSPRLCLQNFGYSAALSRGMRMMGFEQKALWIPVFIFSVTLRFDEIQSDSVITTGSGFL